MSWEQVKYLEDKMSTKIDQIKTVEDIPLNHYFWLQDYKEYGDQSYVVQDDEIFQEALNSHIFIIDPICGPKMVSYLLNSPDGVGKSLCDNFGLPIDAVDWESIKTIANLTASEPAMTAVLQNPSCRKVIFMIKDVVTSFEANPDYTSIVLNAIPSSERVSRSGTCSYARAAFLISATIRCILSGWNGSDTYYYSPGISINTLSGSICSYGYNARIVNNSGATLSNRFISSFSFTHLNLPNNYNGTDSSESITYYSNVISYLI